MTERELCEVARGLERKFRVVVIAVVVMLITMAATLTVAGLVTSRQFDERIAEQRRLELSIYESSRNAKAQTCLDFNDLRSDIRGVLRERLADNTPQERAAALARFGSVDCEKRVERLFGDGPPVP